MKNNVTAKWTSALLSALFVGPSSAGSVLIHEEPNHPNFIHPAFRINPERGKVAVQVSVNDYDSSYSDYTKLVKGLIYDRASNEIRFGDTVCAKVSEHQFLITRWHSNDEMGACVFTLVPRVELGKKLFDGTVACATCHRPALYGTDALPKSIGVEHRLNARNAPSVLNAALQFKAHWIGDRANVEEQAMKSLLGQASFGNPDNAAVIRKIKALPGYADEFAQAFPNQKEPVQAENWGKAIGTYERTLVTPSPFDAYLKGNAKALTPQAQTGLKLFIDVGCVSCHNGVAVGGGTFQKFGVVGDYWKETASQPIDAGRYKETQNPADKYVFKVPSLRNVSMTPPYFHDGSVATLPQAVRIMAKVQLGKALIEGQINDLVAFLRSLTGPLPKEFSCEPVLAPQAFGATQP